MANSFSKEERVAFEQILEGFEDAMVMSKYVTVYKTDMTMMERTSDIIWRPMPYIAQSFDGTDQTANFQSFTQLSVPATIGYPKSVPWTLTATQLRDALQEGRLGVAAKQKLASDINVALTNVAALQGTLVIKRTVAATGFDDIALADAMMNEQGIPNSDRKMTLNTRDYNPMAANLASRGTVSGLVQTAYEKAYVGEIAGFDTFKLNYSYRLPAAAGGGGLTMDTRSTASNYWVPKATSVAATGERSNVDNRYQTITISSTTSVAAGDAFTIAGVNAVHHITKQDTGQLKTFRVISVPTSTTLVISPPIISNQGLTDAEADYQNVLVTTSATAAIVFLNTVAAQTNIFWHKEALELLPARYTVPTDAGVAVIHASTEQGIDLVFQKFYDINTMLTKFRIDMLFGVANVQPEMTGLLLFNQS